MNTFHLSEHTSCRILGFSDTYGIEAGNGVARFLHDFRSLAETHRLPFELVVPARDDTPAGLIPIRAPSFSVPGYGDLKISVPLRHHRKNIERHIKTTHPDCINVSTPGPLGCFGVTLAQRYRIPLVGIYHTDFAAYAKAIVATQLDHLRQEPGQLLAPTAAKLLPKVMPLLGKLCSYNPQAMQDLSTIGEILSRNFKAIADDSRTDDSLSGMAEQAAIGLLKKFYSYFDLIIARSPDQQQKLIEQLSLPPEKMRCLRPGTDVNRFHPNHADRSVWPQLGVPEDAFIVLYVGRITAEKNVGFLRDVWAQVQARQPQCDLRLVAAGHGESRLLESLRGVDKVHLIGSHFGEALSRIYASADLLVFPSTTETLGQVGLEAGASGLPVLVSDRGGPQMYVQQGTSGWVLPANHIDAWCDKIIELGDAPDRMRGMRAAAREHIANHFTLDHSLQSYWDLHKTAVDLRKTRSKPKVRPQVRAADFTHLHGNVPRQGVMLISDFHAGKRYGNPKHRDQKRAAIREMLSLAMERNLEVIFGGDFGDHGAPVARLEADFEAFRNVRDELGFGGRPIFVRGNHDYGFTDQRIEQLTGGCRVQESLVYYHPGAKVVVCHGHIFSLARTWELIRKSDDAEQLIGQLNEDLLDEDLRPAVIAYDIANIVDHGLESHGLRGLSTAWEGVYRYRAMLAEQLLKLAGNSNEADEATWKMIAGLVGTHDNVEVAAMLGVACGGWASLFGHTHEPMVGRKSVQRRQNDSSVAQVVGNSGHINRKRPTCAVAEFPRVTIYQYEHKSLQLRPLRRATLSAADVSAFVERSAEMVRRQELVTGAERSNPSTSIKAAV